MKRRPLGGEGVDRDRPAVLEEFERADAQVADIAPGAVGDHRIELDTEHVDRLGERDVGGANRGLFDHPALAVCESSNFGGRASRRRMPVEAPARTLGRPDQAPAEEDVDPIHRRLGSDREAKAGSADQEFAVLR